MREISDLIKELCFYNSEREWLEFKVNWYDPDELGEYISALSNAASMTGRDHSYMIWGVTDDTHEIVGTKFNCDSDVRGEPLKHYLARQITPDLNFEFTECFIEGKRIVILEIPAAKNSPTAYKHIRYFRIGSSRERLDKFPDREAYLFSILRHGVPSITNTPSEHQDLTFEKLMIYYGAKGITLNNQNFKKNLGLLTEDGKYNILAQLLSDNSHLPLRVAIFSGKTKADNLYSVREFGYQCLLYSLDEVLRYGDVLNIIQADERGRVVERKDVPLFEDQAFREAVINAFVHNKWVSGNEPMLTVFSDRIEIMSRGALPENQTMEGFFNGDSVPVNPKLSEIFLQLHISEKTGRGVPTITQKYGREAFEFRENSIVVTIPFNWINVKEQRSEYEFSYMPGGIIRDSSAINKEIVFLSRTKRIIISLMEQDPNITIPEIALELGLSKPAIDKAIASLKKDGFIRRIGPNKNGSWMVIKK